MDAVIFLFVLSSLPHLDAAVVPSVTSYRAEVQVVSGNLRIFSGETVILKCIIPDIYKSTWNYLWFRASEQLPQTGEKFWLWNANPKESGKYTCQGTRDTVVGSIKTRPSLPVEINVDGGWAILQVPPHPFLVGETLNLTCKIRGNPPVHSTVLYRDDVEVLRQNGSSLSFYLTNATLEDEGMYSCRVSWDRERRTHSVISAPVLVQVVEVLSQPVLEIDAENDQIAPNKLKLICHVRYNARAPAPSINFYFYKNNNRLGLATSNNHDVVPKVPGWYSCRAKVPQLDLSRWSEARSFGKVTGTLKPPHGV